MTLILAYLAGLLTLINPCVLPVLPVVVQSAAADRRAPFALAAGMGVSFVLVGTVVAALGARVDPDAVAWAGAWVMAAFGTVMLVPALGHRFELATAGLAARADAALGHDGAAPRGLWAQGLGGALLGAVWSPCIGPTLGAAIALAASGGSVARAALTMTGFAAGVATLILALAFGLRAAGLRPLARASRPLLGAVFLVTGLVLALRLHHPVEAWLLDRLPPWLIDLSVSL